MILTDLWQRQKTMVEPLFILCPLRSYSSVVCGILGQHPEMYGMPELNLFLADDLGGLLRFIGPRMPHGGDGLLRVLAQLHDSQQTDETIHRALDWTERHRHWSIRQIFDHLTELVAPRLIIDKSPSTVMRPDYLKRLYKNFPNANFLHLLRHPRSMGKSVLDLLKRSDEWGGLLDANRVDPENIWLRAHGNIVDFTNTLPEGQSMRIKGEALLADLEIYLPQIAEWLGVSTDQALIEQMMHPERSPYACRGPARAEFGNDPNFLENPSLDRERLRKTVEPSLEDELDWAPGKFFSKPTLKLAKQFGYR